MKIAQLISNLSYGGAEKQLTYLCDGLRQHGHSVTIASMRSGGELTDQFRQRFEQVREFGMRGPLDWSAYFRVRRWLKQEAPDLLHTHLFKADVYGSIAARSMKIPVISTKHNEDPYLKNPFVGWLARRAAQNCERIVAVSNAVRAHLIQIARLAETRIQVIPLGIPISDSNRVSQRSAESSVRFGIIARLVEQKGHRVLMQAFRDAKESLSHIQLSIFGGGPLEEDLRKLAQSYGLEDCVRFHGVVLDSSQLYDVDVVVLPSLWEGAGLSLLEAMSYGIPVIASKVGGIPELVSQDCGLLVPSGDVSALSAAILKLAQQEDLRKRMSEHCRKHVRKFDFQNTLDATLRLYKEVLDGPSRATEAK